MSQRTHIEEIASRVSQPRMRSAPAHVLGAQGRADPGKTPATDADAAAAPWKVGNLVADRFLVQQPLGRGRYGPIYKALDQSLSGAIVGLEHHIALQEMHPRIGAQPILVERLEQLPQQPQSWSHPNIVKLLEFGRDGAKYFLAMELLEGASLRSILDRGAPEVLTMEETLGVLRGVGDALMYAHAKGIVHGDLRPENVFVTKSFAVKLLDLLPGNEPRSVAFFVEDAGDPGAPDPRDDVYGLACLAYEFLTGRHPYNANSPLEALRAGVAPHPIASLPPLRWAALSRGLALRRERRTATVPEFLAGFGVRGTETLHATLSDSADDAAPPTDATHGGQAAPASAAAPWPEVTASLEATSARPYQPDAPVLSDPVETPDATRVPRKVHFEYLRVPPPPRRKSARTAVGLMLLAGLAVAVYLDYARVRAGATELIGAVVALTGDRLSARTRLPGAQSVQAVVAQPQAITRDDPGRAERVDPTVAAEPAEHSSPAIPIGLPADEATPSIASATVALLENAAERADDDRRPTTRSAPTASAIPRFEFADRIVTVREGQASARIVIRRIGPLDTEAAVAWWTSDGTAKADEDYVDFGARIESFAAGEETRAIYIPLVADSIPEPQESFFVNLGVDRQARPETTLESRIEVVVVDNDR